ncbi:Plant self-incompatibility S1 [Corchorus olitorius]|uniref:Plant self-incompatibility S1 n=1 Tax=Corchorus olitorius TaxID=93759 RepID=A0A1R3GNW1_9ROSI|nr:Plant self-incompatibility S1 [Corchorus olitorius]
MGNIRSLFSLFLVSFLVSTSAAAGLAKEGDKKKPLATIHVMNAIPNPIRLHCSSGQKDYGEEVVHAGAEYQIGVEENASYSCDALWGGLWFANWNAFRPHKDGSRKVVFWLAKSQGVFHSWDNSTWVKEMDWLPF